MSETHFPLDESKLPFSIPKDAQPREKILKLGRMITDRIPAKLHGLTAEDPEYWGLAGVVTDAVFISRFQTQERDVALNVLLQSYDREYAAETCALPEVNFLGRVVRVEFSL